MADQPPSETEFADWLTPKAALQRLPVEDIAAWKRAIITRLGVGDLIAAGHTDMGLLIIYDWLWRDWSRHDGDLWITGDIVFSKGGDHGGPILFVDGIDQNPPEPFISSSFRSVRFDPASFERAFAFASVEPSAMPAPPAKGGRPAGKDGEPIARLTKRLFRMSPEELAGLTVESVTAELIEEYRALGLPPPHLDNARRNAAGILRVVKDE